VGRARRTALAVMVVALAAVAAMTSAEPARADYTGGTFNAIRTADNWAVVDNWTRVSGVPSALPTSTSNPAGWTRIKWANPGVGAAGLTEVTAGSVTLPTLALAAGALVFGWEIGHASGLSDWASGKILGIGQPNALGTITGGNWIPYTCTTGVNDFVPCATVGQAVGTRMWQLRSTGSNPCPDDATTSWEVAWSTTFTGCTEANNAAKLAWMDAVGATAPGATRVTGDCTSDAGTNDCVRWFMGFRTMLGKAVVTETRAYNSTTDTGTKTATITGVPRPPGIDYGTADADAMEEAIEDDPALADEIGRIFYPEDFDTGGGTETETVALPQPRLNETYTAYRTRLRAAGFLGTITLSENAGAGILPEFGPNVVTQVEVQTTTATTTYPLLSPWPDPSPTISVPGEDTEITIEHNPDTAPQPDPGDPGSSEDPPPGNAPPPGGGDSIGPGDCSCPPPDFSPLTGLDFGDRFPFGVVSLVVGTLGTTLYAAPDAPVFDLVVNDGEIGGVGIPGGGHYVVDLDVMDDYVSVVRTLVSWCIWIGGLWWFGSRWFGFKGGGDVGAAVDEAY